jgi:enterochelin esterase-like enzyme
VMLRIISIVTGKYFFVNRNIVLFLIISIIIAIILALITNIFYYGNENIVKGTSSTSAIRNNTSITTYTPNSSTMSRNKTLPITTSNGVLKMESAEKIIGLVEEYLDGKQVDLGMLESLIKQYVKKYGSPITSDSKALFIYIGRANSVSVPGDWNHWNPSRDPMIKIIDDLWILLKTFPSDARLDYKLYVDNKWILDPNNKHLVMGGFGPNSELVMPDHELPPWYHLEKYVLKGEIRSYRVSNKYTGRIHEIDIYIPPNTSINNVEYIAYFYDGGDYRSLGYGDKIIDYLITNNKIPPIIAVFIYVLSSQNRIQEYEKELDITAKFLVEQVIPFIEKKILGLKSSVSRIIVGDSLAGLEALYTLLKYPEIFSYAIIQSPAYWYRYNLLKNMISEISDLVGHKIYVSYGTFEGKRFIQYITDINNMLRGKGAEIIAYVLHEGHSWGQWRETLGYGLIDLIGFNNNSS